MMAVYEWKKVNFTNTRNQELAGLFYTAGQKGSPTLIVCHGFTGSKEGGDKALRMSEFFAQANYDTLLFDFAGNGDSQGEFEDLTLSGQVGDLKSAVDWCKRQGAGKIVTLGRSFGGTTVICHAAEDKRVTAVCTWAAASRLMDLFTGLVDEDTDDPQKVMLAGDEGILYLKKTFFKDIESFNVPQMASRINPTSMLIIHGTEDDVVSPDDAKLIFNAAQEPKKLVYIDGADHQFETHTRQVWEVCLNWLLEDQNV
ncbi:MAG: alpha/beta hydrolase [Firmicutes bacterium]|nr:alpha/beta hydrolase [Bacillota bacterium]